MLRAKLAILLSLALFAGCKEYDPLAHSGHASGGGATATAPDVGGDPSAVVATIDGEKITLAELDEDLKAELTQGRNQYLEGVHGLREQGLERLIDRRLIQRKAKAAGLGEKEYVEKEIFGAIPEPTDDETRMVYDQVAASGQELPPYDDIKGEIAKYLRNQRAEEKIEGFQQGLRAEAKIEKSLPPLLLPKVELGEVKGPIKGDPRAPVTIVEFSDYECGFCKRADPTVAQILEAYPGRVKVVMQHFPLPNHPGAQKAAEAALCADDQGKHWEMHAKLFDNSSALAPDDLKRYAGELNLDAAKFAACLDGNIKTKQVEETLELGRKMGVSSTPMFFVNGRPVSGAQPFDSFKTLIDHELSLANAR